jgi:hypothetical protein
VETSKGGAGRLNTSTLGIHTYTVTSVSKTGLAGMGSISYLVVAPQPPQPPPPAPPKPSPKSQFLLVLEGRSLREVLQSGNLIVSVWVNEGMSVTLVGKAATSSRSARASGTRPIQVFKKKTVGFAEEESKKVTLVLTRKGRAQLALLRSVKLAITGRASGAAGEVAPQTVTSILRR